MFGLYTGDMYHILEAISAQLINKQHVALGITYLA